MNRRSDGISATLPLIDKYSGEVIYASGQDLLPIKDNYQEALASYAYIYRNDSHYYTPTAQPMADNRTNTTTINQNELYGTLNGHEWVDLGLPSGTKWATCNVGAKQPQNPENLRYLSGFDTIRRLLLQQCLGLELWHRKTLHRHPRKRVRSKCTTCNKVIQLKYEAGILVEYQPLFNP